MWTELYFIFYFFHFRCPSYMFMIFRLKVTAIHISFFLCYGVVSCMCSHFTDDTRFFLQAQLLHAFFSNRSAKTKLQSIAKSLGHVYYSHFPPFFSESLWVEKQCLSFLFPNSFSLLLFFIYRHWPTLLSCTLRRPHSSTSEICSCNVRSVFAAECCGPSRSTDSHSCPCRG